MDKIEIIKNADPYKQLEIISKSSCIIGMRYHSIVFAAMTGTPAYAYGYERKMLGFNKRYYGSDGYYDLTIEKDHNDPIPLPCYKKFPYPDEAKMTESIDALSVLLMRCIKSNK